MLCVMEKSTVGADDESNELPTSMSSYLFGFKEVRTYFTLRFTKHIFNDICLYMLQCILAVTVSRTVCMHLNYYIYQKQQTKTIT